MKQDYVPPKGILQKYAQVMIQYALNGGTGIRKGETVYLIGPEYTKPLYMEVMNEIWRQGGNVITRYLPDEIHRYGLNRAQLEIASEEQLTFFAKEYWQGVASSAQHILFLLADPDLHYLEGIDPKRVSLLSTATAPFMKMRHEQERLGKQSWSLCLYGTQSMADEAGMTLEEYWQQIIQACMLDRDNPVAEWRKMQAEIDATKKKLDALQIEELDIVGKDVNLRIRLGKDRKWLGGSGKNIPSFEVFTSPDWRGTNGWIRFNQPLYYSGNKISGIFLEFEDGIVTRATAEENQDILLEMIANENADKVGEFSLTDASHSLINRFMANTLFDENIGGEYGNTHIALGSSYIDAYRGTDGSTFKGDDWFARGFNQCAKVHTDIVSTTNRTVIAHLRGGGEKVIYEDGHFTLD